MTLQEFCEEVEEKTHVGRLEILEMAREAWPTLTILTPTQAKLMVNHIERKLREGTWV